MSSTLYNRGTTAQVAVRRRAEAVDQSIANMRIAISTSDETARLVRILEARVVALERKITALETANVALEARLKASESPAVSATE